MTNVYHIMYRKPGLSPEELFIETEARAQKLLASGRLRIVADERKNFVRFARTARQIHHVFSTREIEEKSLLSRTLQIIAEALRGEFPTDKLAFQARVELHKLKTQAERLFRPDAEVEAKLARAIVQSAHPAVIDLLLHEQVEVFVSFSHTVGDLLDMKTWKTSGESGGLQSTDGVDAAVYVSCGGDPFLPDNYHRHTGDGEAAMARLLTITGQEIGHYADLKRDTQGRIIGRFSCNLSCTRSDAKVQEARMADIACVREVEKQVRSLELSPLVEAERAIRFYEKHKIKNRQMKKEHRKQKQLQKALLRQARKRGVVLPLLMQKEARLGSQLSMCFADMAFNLAPQADAYKREDKQAENAVLCAEALARVPQQANKWGHDITKLLWPNLYAIYYKQVVPACKEAYETLSGEKFEWRFTPPPKKKWWQEWFGS